MWKVVETPFRTNPNGCKWVFKNDYKPNGSLDKHKARLMAKDLHRKKTLIMMRLLPP
jgi:hypothetical protein